jgi:hypothetical protein
MPQQSGAPRELTPELLRQLQAAPERLAAYSVAPTSITVVDAVEVIYKQIQHLKANGYGWLEIQACLAQEITLFNFASVPLSTLQAAYYATIKRFEPDATRSRKRGRKLNRILSAPTLASTPIPADEPMPVIIDAPALDLSPIDTLNTPVLNQSTLAPLPEAPQPSTPDELEAALQIPDREDEVAIERFRFALHQLKSIDARRWRILMTTARNADIRLSETTVQCSTQQLNQMFNQY